MYKELLSKIAFLNMFIQIVVNQEKMQKRRWKKLVGVT